MKANKAIKRLTHVEDLLLDVMERYSAGGPDIRESLQGAKTAVSRAKDAVSLQETSEKKIAPKTDASKKAAVKVRRTKVAKKHDEKRS
jgi:hypothetical protein